MNGYRCVSGPITVEGEEALLKLAQSGTCPTCRGRLRDLRRTGFNTRAIEREAVCFWWAEDAYTCLARPAR